MSGSNNLESRPMIKPTVNTLSLYFPRKNHPSDLQQEKPSPYERGECPSEEETSDGIPMVPLSSKPNIEDK